MVSKLLEVTDLETHFISDDATVKAVDNVSFYINNAETLGIVGESGCGKSVTSLSIMRLLKNTPGKIVGGEITFLDQNLLNLSEKEMRAVRGNQIAMIFQEPMTSLNPVYKIGRQIEEGIRLHLKLDKAAAKARALEMLELVGIPRAKDILNEYPYQLSGGMRQRVMIAMAMSCVPKLLIADEPTTALDVTIQAQILDLMRDLRKNSDTSILMITHDLGVVAEMCDRVIVMYAGQIVEEASVLELFENPQHPYTKGLINSIPKLGNYTERLDSIPGNVPTPENMPTGCRFAPRCSFVMKQCLSEAPMLKGVQENHSCRCWLSEVEKND
ncbi:ABC transporter ATP-binding protein [Viridibacillus arvi]|uniref:Peptide ABC transporter ATP-binding protein n=1 Tax=Viridibacillus arvi TaxID=263475 RepID=A0A0M0LDX6_9BACL|nr:ABC transporter ATP-binding protein [Viridibacillus arvi]KOO49102.1 peptide ABC transporter ATP-binding protein [Viridibacillus arvi]